MKVRTLFISDTHLGSDHCSHEKILKLLSNIECDYLYIVGDFIDGWALNRKFKWNNNYNVILQKILRLSRKGTMVIYLWGNHDDFVEPYTNFYFGDNIHILRNTNHVTKLGEKILILHGDQFDGIVSKSKWIQKIGAIIYDFSLSINGIFRIFKFSFSNFLKSKAKEAVKYVSNFENIVSNYCIKNNYSSILCGHIHKAENRVINGIKYYNCGDWVESNTFIIEDEDGNIRLMNYEDIIWNTD